MLKVTNGDKMRSPKIRRPHFEFEEPLRTLWHGENYFKTALFNSFSFLAPVGEKYVIDSASVYQSEVKDPELMEQLNILIAQESTHRLYHLKYNKIVCEQRGYVLEEFEEKMHEHDKWAEENLSPLEHLATAVAFEHITALIATGQMKNKNWFKGANTEISDFWAWHAIEEIEHRSAAHELYKYMGGKNRTLHLLMLGVTFRFFQYVFRNIGIMRKRDGKSFLKVWPAGLWYLFGPMGTLTRLIPRYFSFFRGSFSPDNLKVDDRFYEIWDHFDKQTPSPAS